MLLLRRRAYARAGLAGNPSDGYHGKTLSVIVKNFWAEVALYEWDEIEIIWSQEDKSRFRTVDELVTDVRLHGYYGGVRLVKATIKKFVEFCRRQNLPLHDRTFSVRYETNIPRQVGLAGSSAIIVATLRALFDFYGLQVPMEVQPSLALSVENDELKITAGLQDRVIQIYEGLVFMDFARETMQESAGLKCGRYERLDPTLLPTLYVACAPDQSEPTEMLHTPLRARYEQGDPEVRGAMIEFAAIADRARAALVARDHAAFSRAMNDNFDLRRKIIRLHPFHVQMVEQARAVGASAKFAGSGGAIVGAYEGEAMFAALRTSLEGIGCRVFKPAIA